MPVKPFEAAIFDLDGVIVDTAKFHSQAWKRLAEELGFAFSEKENEQLKGVSRMDSLELLLRAGGITNLTRERKERLASRKNEWYKEYLATLTPACYVFEDAAAGVEGAIRAGMRVVGVGTESLLARAHVTVTSFEQLEPVFLLSRIGVSDLGVMGDRPYEQ